MHACILEEVSVNSQFLCSAYGLKVNQRKAIKKRREVKIEDKKTKPNIERINTLKAS